MYNYKFSFSKFLFFLAEEGYEVPGLRITFVLERPRGYRFNLTPFQHFRD
jgi:hypothetical protein